MRLNRPFFTWMLLSALSIPGACEDQVFKKSIEGSRSKTSPLNQYEQAMEPVRNLAILQATAEIKKDPKNAAAYAKRAKAYAQKKDFKAALADYDQALELDPKLVELYPKRAIAHFMLRDVVKSAEDVRKADENHVEVTPLFRGALEEAMRDPTG